MIPQNPFGRIDQLFTQPFGFFNDKIHFATDEFYGIEASNERALRLAEFWKLYFEFVGGLYYRWGLPEEQEKFFRGNAITLRTQFMQKQGNKV